MQAAAHPAKVDYLYFARKPDHMHHFFTASESEFEQFLADARLRLTTRHVALLGHPVSHSLSPLMQNAAFAAAGLDWHYSAFDVEDAVEAVARAADARLRGRERHDPAQAGRRRRVRRGRGRGGEHARLPRRPRARLQHGPRDPRRDRREARVRDRRGRRDADARARRCRPTRASSRAAATGRRTPTGCDLIVNATPVRDELLVAAGRGADGRRARLRARRRRDGARRRGARGGLRGDRRPRGARPPGREELRALDRRRRRRWTVMRDAVRAAI